MKCHHCNYNDFFIKKGSIFCANPVCKGSEKPIAEAVLSTSLVLENIRKIIESTSRDNLELKIEKFIKDNLSSALKIETTKA